jgi:hypothetical protein
MAKARLRNRQRTAFPGIYDDPRDIADRAAANTVPESPYLEQIFGVTRRDLAEMSRSPQGDPNWTFPGAAPNPKGSESAYNIMTPSNRQRILDIFGELENRAPGLVEGMEGWYMRERPALEFLKDFSNDPRGDFDRYSALTAMASPGSDVYTEINRGGAALYHANAGLWDEFAALSKDRPIEGVMGHPYHSTAQMPAMAKYLESGQIMSKEPKVPTYFAAGTGRQSGMPVGDAHWSRGVGLADVRQSKKFDASASGPEMQMLTPWWQDIAQDWGGRQAVPAQATLWGGLGRETGVESRVGAPKLELEANAAGTLAAQRGISPKQAMGRIMTGLDKPPTRAAIEAHMRDLQAGNATPGMMVTAGGVGALAMLANDEAEAGVLGGVFNRARRMSSQELIDEHRATFEEGEWETAAAYEDELRRRVDYNKRITPEEYDAQLQAWKTDKTQPRPGEPRGRRWEDVDPDGFNRDAQAWLDSHGFSERFNREMDQEGRVSLSNPRTRQFLDINPEGVGLPRYRLTSGLDTIDTIETDNFNDIVQAWNENGGLFAPEGGKTALGQYPGPGVSDPDRLQRLIRNADPDELDAKWAERGQLGIAAAGTGVLAMGGTEEAQAAGIPRILDRRQAAMATNPDISFNQTLSGYSDDTIRWLEGEAMAEAKNPDNLGAQRELRAYRSELNRRGIPHREQGMIDIGLAGVQAGLGTVAALANQVGGDIRSFIASVDPTLSDVEAAEIEAEALGAGALYQPEGLAAGFMNKIYEGMGYMDPVPALQMMVPDQVQDEVGELYEQLPERNKQFIESGYNLLSPI